MGHLRDLGGLVHHARIVHQRIEPSEPGVYCGKHRLYLVGVRHVGLYHQRFLPCRTHICRHSLRPGAVTVVVDHYVIALPRRQSRGRRTDPGAGAGDEEYLCHPSGPQNPFDHLICIT